MGDKKQPERAVTAQVFRAGVPVHLRMSVAHLERMLPVACHGVQLPQHELLVQWTEDALALARPPAPGLELQVYSVVSGIMNIAKACTSSVADGRLPRLRLAVDRYCLAVPLRAHDRRQVLGQVRLGAYGSTDVLRQNRRHPMDLSLGGFGFQTRALELAVGTNLEFNLQLWHGDDRRADHHQPELVVAGQSIIRCIQPVDQAGQVWIGLEFSGLAEEAGLALQTWLSGLPPDD